MKNKSEEGLSSFRMNEQSEYPFLSLLPIIDAAAASASGNTYVIAGPSPV